ncbi:uncharacterized protein [Pseudochaenichthys georgianus]|uniref:uncharacterized protein n=1 Tax=Pseudochaenichthys georgianus TaxID=52239 RepID=UPI0039C47B5E
MGCCVGGVYKCYTRPPRDLLAGWVDGDGCSGAFVLRCILTRWQPQMEVEAADNNNTSGAGRKQWKWFDLFDQIYGHRPANVGREGGLDSATALLESLQDDYIGTCEEEHSRTTGDGSVPSTSSLNPERTPAEDPNPTQPPTPSAITTPQRMVLGKRKRGGEDRAQQERHHEQHMAQQERHLDWAKASAERRWELDVALRREEAALRRRP